MKGLRSLTIAVVLMMTFAIGVVQAEDIKTAGYASADVMSNYVWRGQTLSNSWVIQPTVGITYGGFGANIWANFDPDHADIPGGETNHSEVTETDLAVTYAYSIDKLTLIGGYIFYSFDSFKDTQEVYLSAAYDTFLKPALTVYYDFDEGNGAFVVASVGHSIPMPVGMTLNLGASASYNINNKIMGFDEDGDDFSNFYNGELSSSLNIPVYKAISVTPKIAYSFPLSDDAKDAIHGISDDGDREVLYGGINVSLSF